MGEKRKNIYENLQRKLGRYPDDDFVRAYAKAYLEADVETIRKLQEFLVSVTAENSEPEDLSGPDAYVGAPIQPRPHLNSGAIALPEPYETNL
jgi:hypothetical protein